MCLVAQPLHEIEHRIARPELHRIAPGNEEGFAAGVALRAFRDSNERNIRHPKRGECLARGIELTEAAVDQEEIGPRRFGRLLDFGFIRMDFPGQ